MLHNAVSTVLENVEFISENSSNISQKTSILFLKIVSVQNVNHSKIKRRSMFPAVNGGKRLLTRVGREFTAGDESTPFG
jgi:hypothetical protein